MYPDIFENGVSFPPFAKKQYASTRSESSNRSRQSTHRWKYDSSPPGACVIFLVYDACMTSWYSKTSVFVGPQVNESPTFFLKSPLQRAVLKRCVFGDRFHRMCFDGGPNQRKIFSQCCPRRIINNHCLHMLSTLRSHLFSNKQ